MGADGGFSGPQLTATAAHHVTGWQIDLRRIREGFFADRIGAGGLLDDGRQAVTAGRSEVAVTVPRPNLIPRYPEEAAEKILVRLIDSQIVLPKRRIGYSNSGRCPSKRCPGASVVELGWQASRGPALGDWSSSFAPRPTLRRTGRAELQYGVQMRVPSNPPKTKSSPQNVVASTAKSAQCARILSAALARSSPLASSPPALVR